MEKILYSKLYKKHYPFKTVNDVKSLSLEDRKKLVNLMNKAPENVVASVIEWNRKGVGFQLNYEKLIKVEESILDLSKKLFLHREDELSYEEIVSLNFILDLYKHNWLIRLLTPSFIFVNRWKIEAAKHYAIFNDYEKANATNKNEEVNNTEVCGNWVLERSPDGKPYCYHCSNCDLDFHYIGVTIASDFCPNCGVPMNEKVLEVKDLMEKIN